MKKALSIAAVAEGRFDGVGDFAAGLARALAPAGFDVETVTRDSLGSWRGLPDAAGRGVVLHYVAPLYLTRDLPSLSGWLRRTRESGSRIVIVVHEYMPPRDSIRRRMASVGLGLVLRTLLRNADAAVVTHEVAKRELEGMGFRPSPAVIPVASTIPELASADAPQRRFVMFGQPASFDGSLMRAFADYRQQIGVPLVWFTRSAGEAVSFLAAHGIPNDAVQVRAGEGAAAIAQGLSSSFASLAPIVDGVSTRRTTVAAALAHGLPIAGTDGACTSERLRRDPAFVLSAPGDRDAFVRNVVEIARADTRPPRAAAARALHDELFAWNAVARRYAALLEPA